MRPLTAQPSQGVLACRHFRALLTKCIWGRSVSARELRGKELKVEKRGERSLPVCWQCLPAYEKLWAQAGCHVWNSNTQCLLSSPGIPSDIILNSISLAWNKIAGSLFVLAPFGMLSSQITSVVSLRTSYMATELCPAHTPTLSSPRCPASLSLHPSFHRSRIEKWMSSLELNKSRHLGTCITMLLWKLFQRKKTGQNYNNINRSWCHSEFTNEGTYLCQNMKYNNNNSKSLSWGCSLVVEHLLRIHEAVGSTPNTTKKN